MSKKWQTNLGANVRRWPPRDRNWPVVRVLAAVSVILFGVSALVELKPNLEFTYRLAAMAVGAVVVLFHQDRRLFVDRPPI